MSASATQPSVVAKGHSSKPAAQTLGDLCFIETQFPVSKMSKESYAERRANQSQTITGLGKWWGRKPLILCRATIVSLLLPATDNPAKDREVFLRILTMDDDGMLRRKSVNIAPTAIFKRLPPTDRNRYFEPSSDENKAKLKRGLTPEEKQDLQTRIFNSLSYDERLEYCDRPEQIDGPSAGSWEVINAHLGTNATSLPELVAELGKRRFGHVPRVGDSFCGGGSIPFEAARIGCAAYASDLNPAAALLTWASLNIVGGGPKVATDVHHALREVFDAVDQQITEWGIEHREPDRTTKRRWRADAYLYCTEVTCPECGWRVPLSPTWLIGPTSQVVAILRPDSRNKRFEIEILSDVSADQMKKAAASGTFNESELVCPNANCKARTPIRAIRGDGRGNFGDSKSKLRGWDNKDVVPRADDIFGERLYCIRWVDTWTETDSQGNEKEFTERYFHAPSADDLKREHQVLDLLASRFEEWQKRGFIPNRKIEPGAKTGEPIRTRGWTHWHHLFTPRQLLINGLFLERAEGLKTGTQAKVASLLGVGRCADWNSRLCRWGTGAARESIAQTFSNQALNTLYTYASKALSLLDGSWIPISPVATISGTSEVAVQDARTINHSCDAWITDPPYADAVNYHELSEFFLAWYAGGIQRLFPKWTSDSRRALAVQGADESFRHSMVAAYRRLASHMPDNGFQVVMFTHQDPAVWADLALILWGGGLRVTAAWCIQTEREASGTRDGNYVQGTVLLVLRKQTSEETAFLDEVYQDVEAEVRRQLDTMRDLDDAKDPNFTDTDYQLAAYAAALRVLTAKKIQEIDVSYELSRTRKKGEKSPVEELIERAVTIACDHLVPKGIETHLWKSLSAMERLYLKGLELESHGEHRTGVYQELARGFGVEEYTPLLASTKANETRLKTATEFGRKEMNDDTFGTSIVRHALFATHKTVETESPRDGITWLTTEVTDYKSNRQRIIEIIEFLAARRQNASLTHWHKDAEAAGILAGALRNRQDNV
jgi:putative DNA methylase